MKRVCITNRKPRRFELRDVLWISRFGGEGQRRGGERIAKYSFLWNMGVVKAHIRYLFSSEYVILLQFNFISLLCYVIRFFFLLFLFITRSLVEDRGNLYILSGTS